MSEQTWRSTEIKNGYHINESWAYGAVDGLLFISIALNYILSSQDVSIRIWDWKSLFVKVKVSKINGIGSQFNDDIAIK